MRQCKVFQTEQKWKHWVDAAFVFLQHGESPEKVFDPSKSELACVGYVVDMPFQAYKAAWADAVLSNGVLRVLRYCFPNMGI